MQGTKVSSQPFRFLDLPYDIRDLIYEITLEDNPTLLAEEWKFGDADYRPILQLIKTCRTIREEASSVIYRTAVWLMIMPYRKRHLDWLDMIGPDTVRIRRLHVRLRLPEYSERTREPGGDIGVLMEKGQYFLETLAVRLPNVRELRISLDVNFRSPSRPEVHLEPSEFTKTLSRFKTLRRLMLVSRDFPRGMAERLSRTGLEVLQACPVFVSLNPGCYLDWRMVGWKDGIVDETYLRSEGLKLI